MNLTGRLRRQRLMSFIVTALLLGSSSASLADQALQGHVEESGIEPTTLAPPRPVEPLPAPVVPARKKKTSLPAGAELDELKGAGQTDALHGSVQQDALKGRAEDTGTDLTAGQGKIDPTTGMLQGSARKEGVGVDGMDPDEQDRELMIEWDRWHNRFLTAVQTGMQERLNNADESELRWDPVKRVMTSRYPLGTVAWFSCQVTPSLEIVRLKLVHSSGFPGYDQAVLDAVSDLSGSSILRYPRGSKRHIVREVAGIYTAETARRQYFKFGDVERQIITGR